MAKINVFLKISVLLVAMALAVVPYASAFEVVGDDMDYILSHVSSEEWEAAKKLWSRTIQLNINEGTEIPPDFGVVLEPSRSEWGIKKDPSNPDVYIMSLTGLPQKPFSEQKAQTATEEPLSPKEQESREARNIAWTIWGNRSNDHDNVTFTVPSTGSKWLFVPINYNHQLYKYGKLDANGRVENFIGESEAVSIEDLIEEWTAKGKDVSQLIAMQKQIEELTTLYKAKYEREAQEAAAASKKSSKKEPSPVVPVEEQNTVQVKTEEKETVTTASAEKVAEKQDDSSAVVASEISADEKAVDSKQASEPVVSEPQKTEQKPKKRVSFFEKILNWFR